MTLHEAIKDILLNNKALFAKDLADTINNSHLYNRRDGKPITSTQVLARVNNYPDLFSIRADHTIELINRELIPYKEAYSHLKHHFRSSYLNDERSDVLLLSLIFAAWTKEKDVDFQNISDNKRILFTLFKEVQEKYQIPTLFQTSYAELERISDGLCNYIVKVIGTLKVENKPPSEVFGDFFNEITNDFLVTDARRLGEHSTPNSVSLLMASLLDLPTNSRIFDPFAGHAGTLVQYLKLNKNQSFEIIAGDVDQKSVELGILNLLANGCSNFIFRKVGGFAGWKEPLSADGFISNPPFKIHNKIPIRHEFHQYSIELDNFFNSVRSDFFNSLSGSIFLSIYHTNNKGKSVIVVPDGFLSGQAREYSSIRRYLIQNNILSAVISLPQGSYRPYANVNTSIIVLDKAKVNNHVFFYNATDLKQETLSEKIPNILSSFKSKAKSAGLCAWIATDEVVNENFDFTPKVYLTEKIETTGLKTLGEYIVHYFSGSTIPRTNINEKEGVPFIQVGELEDEGGYNEFDPEKIKYYVSDIELLRAAPRYIPYNAVLVSKVGIKLKPTLFNYNKDCLCNSNIIVLMTNTDTLLPEYLVTELQSEYVLRQVNEIRKSVGIPNFSQSDFLRIKIRVPSIEDQRAFVTQYYGRKLKAEKVRSEKNIEDELYNLISIFKHEIKQPISSIGMYVNVLESFLRLKSNDKKDIEWTVPILELLPGQSDEDIKDMTLEKIFSGLNLCLKTTQTTLSKAEETLNIGKGDFIPEKFNLKTHLQTEIIRLFQNNCCTINLLGDEIELNADKYQISVLFKHLIENAIKHGFRGKLNKENNVINIHLLKKGTDDPFNEIIVENNGTPPDDNFSISILKEKGNTSDRLNGTGFGGYHILKVIENHKGEILFANKSEVAHTEFKTKFKIYLP
jgi:type I restriction-modification system DNA methylase subunit/signal transduction histidine kinase